MDHFSCRFSSLISTVVLLFLASYKGGVLAATFTFVNKCEYTVWPGILPNAGSPSLDSTGFELPKDSSRSFIAPTGWSGRFWARTGCNFVESGVGSCSTGDCGSGQVECNGLGAAPPATLAEFTLGSGGQDFYDVSLVDGYNLPMVIEAVKVMRVRARVKLLGAPEYCCSVTLMMMPPALLLVVALIIQLPFALPPQVRNLQATQHQRQKEHHHRDLLQDPGWGTRAPVQILDMGPDRELDLEEQPCSQMGRG
ncbi:PATHOGENESIS-RELATED THAUMATIN SUPERFAMILY PROTEIN [Salix purpurea]|uniref:PATHOGENESIS-RELATED THAUMATIN SUPERFAMILY PROTEIN n=1 Tax=Salix purpurea TaxID=77065 RepID=A0A9Q0PQZ6_SALPP|nr:PATHOGENESIS-RELATED THAUMATIN SUPERFAMILY PROTEIN [Salix purpurea]